MDGWMAIGREWMIDHLEIESTVLHKESEEGKAQLQMEGASKLGEAHSWLYCNGWMDGLDG
jgi:hypothetical protein